MINTKSIVFLFSFFTSVFLHLPSMTMSDNACAYPCYPTPTGSGTPTVNTPPSPPSQSGIYPPPGNYPTPSGNLPYYPPPPYGNNYYGTPPPPDPILPYFPFYYRKPPHGDQSFATRLPKETSMSVTTNVLVFTVLFGPLLL